MSSDGERLYGEISEIAARYQREVPSGRRAWPESIRSRVLALRRSGVRCAEISRRRRSLADESAPTPSTDGAVRRTRLGRVGGQHVTHEAT
jgi:hypothetical protein